MTSTVIIPIRQLMSTDLFVVNPNDTMERVHEIFNSNPIHHLPVVDERGRVQGMISKSDYLSITNAFPLFREDLREAANERLFKSLLVEDVMSRQIATLSPNDPITVAAGYFQENLFHALPIVEEDVLVGILTTYDLLTYFFNQTDLLEAE
jgi:CBS domain-containing protein